MQRRRSPVFIAPYDGRADAVVAAAGVASMDTAVVHDDVAESTMKLYLNILVAIVILEKNI